MNSSSQGTRYFHPDDFKERHEINGWFLVVLLVLAQAAIVGATIWITREVTVREIASQAKQHAKAIDEAEKRGANTRQGFSCSKAMQICGDLLRDEIRRAPKQPKE